MSTFRRNLFLVLVVFSLSQCGTSVASAQAAVSGKAVRELIEQLGNERYAIRERAKEKLQQIGLEAFDELQSVENDDTYSIEVSTAARHLVSSLLVSWSKESDPPAVRAALDEYGAQTIEERGSRIALLARLPDRKGLDALVRLTRFETDSKLSRRAALAAMEQPMSEDQSSREARAEVMMSSLAGSQRQGCEWMRVYANDLPQATYKVEAWRELVAKQRAAVDRGTNQKITRKSVLDLVRICSARAAKADERVEALRLAKEHIDLILPKTRDLVDACNWAIDNKLHEFVLDLRDRNQHIFDSKAKLLYAAAESYNNAGQQDEAEQLASRARGLAPFPDKEDEKKKLSEKEIEEIAQAHLTLAKSLADRGLFDWAEKEYNYIIDNVEVVSFTGTEARSALSQMLGELLEHQKVIDTLEPFIERANKDREFRQRISFGLISISYLHGELEFHRGLLAKKNGVDAEARKWLKSAYGRSQYNVDILIEMHRMDGDEQWKEEVRRLLHRRLDEAESTIRSREATYKRNGQREIDGGSLANALNEYAWLVSNTEGDYQRALQESLRSLRLTPKNAALIDTCARCYMSVEDWDNAFLKQKEALELMPHSPPMVRQLSEINKQIAARDSGVKKEGEDNPAGDGDNPAEDGDNPVEDDDNPAEDDDQ